MARDAFSRARRFLSYNAAARWCAPAAAVGSAVLFVALIALLGLFAELMVSQGRFSVPSTKEEEELVRWLTEEMVRDPEQVALVMPPLSATGEKRYREWLVTTLENEPQAREVAERPRAAGAGLLSLAWRMHNEAHQRFLAEEWTWYHQLGARLFAAPARWFVWSRHNHSYLIGLAIIAAAFIVARSLLALVMHHAAASAAVEATSRLRRAVHHHTYRLGTLALHPVGPSEAVGVFTRDLEAVHDGLYTWLTVVVREPTKFFLLLVLALIVDFWICLAFLLFAALVWIIGGQLAAYFRAKGQRTIQRAAEQMSLLRESIMMMRLVKAFGMELFNQARVERQLSEYSHSLRRRHRHQAIYRTVMALLGVLAVVLLFFAAGWAILEQTLSVAGTITVCAALVSLYWPMAIWLEHRRLLRRARQAARSLFQFLDRGGEVAQVVGAEFLPPMSGQLAFDHVTLREPGEDGRLLNGVSLQIQAGQRVALVGQDEREKHALVYLVLRFLDPDEGEIRIDGHDLRWVTLESLRAQIGIVLQHNLVFNDTVGDNIGCGDPGYKLPQIIEAAKMAHAHHFIQRLPAGYKTVVGDMGHPLSIDEQFRIGLARAILRDPAILIVEEPTASLDDDVKASLDDTFARLAQGRTLIFLPHRVTTMRSCDRIFVFYKGQVQATGDHRELLSESELYRHLQYVEFNVFAERT